MSKHIGRLQIDPKFLLELIDYTNGKLCHISYDFETARVQLVIEHPDMPEVKEGDCIPIINPVYTREEHRLEAAEQPRKVYIPELPLTIWLSWDSVLGQYVLELNIQSLHSRAIISSAQANKPIQLYKELFTQIVRDTEQQLETWLEKLNRGDYNEQLLDGNPFGTTL